MFFKGGHNKVMCDPFCRLPQAPENYRAKTHNIEIKVESTWPSVIGWGLEIGKPYYKILETLDFRIFSLILRCCWEFLQAHGLMAIDAIVLPLRVMAFNAKSSSVSVFLHVFSKL